MSAQNTYNYIVVGAGSAGSALAARLSEDPANRVLLLEAGGKSHPWSVIPIGYARMIDNPAVNWCYSSEPEVSTNGRRIPVPRGRMLGGSSSINGLVFVRGQARDFDTWAQLGNPGWSYADVLPVYKRLENYSHGSDQFRGRSGPLKVTLPEVRGPLFDALVAGCAELGIPHNQDYNGATQEGIALSQATIANGRRMSTARGYLKPNQHRANLDIRTGALTSKIQIDQGRAQAVEYIVDGQSHVAYASEDIILSAGSINSPQLLELSGIGQPGHLQELGITVRHALPGVGENLRDHYAPRTRWEISAKGATFNDSGRGFGLLGQVFRYLTEGQGMLCMPAAPFRAFVKTRDGLDDPDALLGWVPMLYEPGYKLSNQPGATCYAHAIRPDSTGSVHIADSNPKTPPSIRFNFLSASTDIDTTLRAVRLARSIMKSKALNGLGTKELAPGESIESDDELLDWVKANAETTYHPVGTCKMGNDPMAVVDHKLRVHGIENLRVADASVMPTMPSGNTNAPSIMIGERAADFILESA